MQLEWIEEQPNYHVARLHLTAVGVTVEAVAKVFLVSFGYVAETGIGAAIQTDGGRLGFDEAKTLATRMLEHQLKTLQEQIQKVLTGGTEASFGEVKPDGG